jgi:hypothetical protein
LGLSLLGAAVFWALSGWLARVVLDDPSRANDIAWLSLAVALTVAAGSQGALLTGLRRVGDLARINVLSGIVGAALGVAALWLWGEAGLLALVLVAPVATFLPGHVYVSRLGPPVGPPTRLPELAQEWAVMARLGAAFMISALVTVLALQLLFSLRILNLWATMIRDAMIGGASVEQTLALWASSLQEAKRRLRPLCTQERVAASATRFLDGLLSDEPRKAGWLDASRGGG